MDNKWLLLVALGVLLLLPIGGEQGFLPYLLTHLEVEQTTTTTTTTQNTLGIGLAAAGIILYLVRK